MSRSQAPGQHDIDAIEVAADEAQVLEPDAPPAAVAVLEDPPATGKEPEEWSELDTEEAAPIGAEVETEEAPPIGAEVEPPPDLAQPPKGILQMLADQLGVDAGTMARELRAELGDGEYDPRDLEGNPLRFFKCTETHYGPVLLPNGMRQAGFRSRPNAPLTEVCRVWVKGRIYPFRSLRQLPKQTEAQWHRDEEGNIQYMEDPQRRGDPRANLLPKPKMQTDAHGKRTQVYQPTGQVEFFEEVKIPANQVMMFLHGAGFQQTRIENPVSGPRIPGNYVNNSQMAQARSLSVAEKAQMAERELMEHAHQVA